MFQARDEKPEDVLAPRHVNDIAFGQPNEGRIVDTIRLSSDRAISLIALPNGKTFQTTHSS